MNRKPKMILRQLKQLSRIEPKDEALEHAIANAKARLASLATEPARPLSHNPKTSFFRGPHMFSRIATLVLVCAAIIAILVMLALPDRQGQLAFAQVIEQVQQTQSLSFKVKSELPGGYGDSKGKAPSPVEDESRMMVLPNGRMRSENPKGYSIQDAKARKMILVDKESKTAHIFEGFSPPSPSAANLNVYEMIKNIRQKAVERLPDEKIDGRKAIVFRVDVKEVPKVDKNSTWKVWTDPKTALPIQIEIAAEDENGKTMKSVIYAIEFDRPFDPSLFSFAPPAGYSVQTSGCVNFPSLPDKPELRAPEIIPGVGLGPIRFGMSRDKIESLIGKPDGYESNNTSLLYYSRGFFLTVSHRSGLKNIHCVSQMLTMNQVREFAGKTKEGIGLGSSLREVEKVFGKPDRDEGHDAMNKELVYTKVGLEIQFYGDKVINIDMCEVLPQPDGSSSEKNKVPGRKGPITKGKSMRINVVGPDGKPMAGARILAAIWSKELTAAKKNQTYSSDAHGQITIELPQTFEILRLFTRCDGYVPLFTHWEQLDENPPDTFAIQLTKGTVIGGFVKNKEGRPIAGAKVEVMLSQDHSEQSKRTSFTCWLAEGDDARITDAEGRWTLNNVPEGEVKLLFRIVHPDYIGNAVWGSLQKEQGITLQSLRDRKTTIILPRKK